MRHASFVQASRARLRELGLLTRAIRNFLTGFAALRVAGPCVTVFGSARVQESHGYYVIGREIGRRLSERGFTVMTGGGPGLMEAANRGAKEAGGLSIACNIRLPVEQAANAFLDRHVTCQHFFVRKVLLFKYSHAFVVLPGGFGTMDELFELLTLVQTGKVERFPIVLIGLTYWQPLLAFLEAIAAQQMIDASDLSLLMATDDVGQAVAHIEHATAVSASRLLAGAAKVASAAP